MKAIRFEGKLKAAMEKSLHRHNERNLVPMNFADYGRWLVTRALEYLNEEQEDESA